MLRSIYAGLQQTSVTYEEASQNLGASPAHTLYKITLPLVIANIIAGFYFGVLILNVGSSRQLNSVHARSIQSDYQSHIQSLTTTCWGRVRC